MPSSIASSVSDRSHLRKVQTFYPSRLFSMSDHYLPENIKEIFRFCKYLVLTDPAVSGAVHKLSESPITDLVYDHQDTGVQDRYKDLFEDGLKIREKLLEAIFDLVTYSNAFLSFEVPITRYLISPNLHQDIKSDSRLVQGGDMEPGVFDIKYREQLGGVQKINKRFRADRLAWELTGNGQFQGPCPVSGKHVIFERQDRYYPSSENVSVKRWDPNKITIQHNEVTGQSKYYYTMGYETRKLINLGDRDHLINDPWEYIIAARTKRNVRIKNDKLYHLSNVKISGAFEGWGVPRLFAAFKLIFYYMTLLRANEATAIGRINDLTILFPQSQSSLLDPASAVPGSSFRRNMMAMMKAHQRDKNFVGVSPIPVGSLSVFGQGRMQLVSQEMEPIIRMICVALGLPYDMLFGGGAYTGQAVGQRVFTSQTGLNRERFNELLDFLVGKCSNALGTDKYSPEMRVTLKEVEGPDDIQKKSVRVNLALNNKLSLETVMKDLGLDPTKEFESMEEEAKKINRIQLIQAEGMARGQAAGSEIVARSEQRVQEQQQQQQMGMDPMAGQMTDEMGNPVDEMGNPVDPSGMPPEEGGVAPGQEADPAEAEAQEQAAMYMQYIRQAPDMEDDILEYAFKKSPRAYEILVEMLQTEQSGGEIPGMEAPDMGGPGGGGFDVADTPVQQQNQTMAVPGNPMPNQLPGPNQ